MSKEEAFYKLTDLAENGKFLIRKSGSLGLFAIEIFFDEDEEKIIRFHIELDQKGKLKLKASQATQPNFDNLSNLVKFYQKNSIFVRKNNRNLQIKLVD